MTKTRLKKKLSAQNRAAPSPAIAPQYAPGGSLMYVPPGYAQSLLGQTYYGGTLKNAPSQWTSLFSPGTPLPPQPAVNPNGLPVQFRFPVAYNSFPVDRTLGNPDIPSFEQLRRLAIMDYGIALCERYWLDMVPRMTLKISLTKEAVAGGAEEKNYQKEMNYFKTFFSRPDAGMDIHSWLRAALINQSRYDELYIYKNRTRGGKLMALEIIDGSQMKPLLDDWGRLPPPPKYAYQQYPWGIPGYQYTQDQMTHYRESPASDTPYGFSRIERIILITSLALKKQKMDLAHFTEGNIPAGILMPPAGSNWTPDQLDSYEQSWNALLAGNLQQLARIKVVQPGFAYTPFVQPNFDSVFDRFLLNIRTSAYGMTMSDLGFTETVNKSSGDTQENVTYRRTIGPIAMIYAMILTDYMQHDFEPSLHGDLFEVSFGGYEESEDAESKAKELTMYASAGILGLTNAAKLAKLPEDPDAPHIGRVIMGKDGPIFLDDMASDKMREAAVQAKLAGLELAANPQPAQPAESEGEGDDEETGQTSAHDKSADPQQQQTQKVAQAPEQDTKKPTQTRAIGDTSQTRTGEAIAISQHEEERVDESRPQQNTEDEARSPADPGRGDTEAAARATPTGHQQFAGQGDNREAAIDYRRWRTRAIDDAKSGRKQRGFTSTYIPATIHAYLTQCLSRCSTAEDVRTVFTRAQKYQESELIGGEPLLEYNAKLDIWEASDTEQQLEAMRMQGTLYLQWETGISASGVCPVCGVNDGEVVEVGKQFKSGHRLPQCHLHCECRVVQYKEKPVK